MALIISKSYILTNGANPDIYTVSYWRVSKISLDMDSQFGLITLKGYKNKQYRIDNGINSNYTSIDVRINSNNYKFTNENINQYNLYQLAYMTIKSSFYDSESDNINWANAEDDIEE